MHRHADERDVATLDDMPRTPVSGGKDRDIGAALRGTRRFLDRGRIARRCSKPAGKGRDPPLPAVPDRREQRGILRLQEATVLEERFQLARKVLRIRFMRVHWARLSCARCSRVRALGLGGETQIAAELFERRGPAQAVGMRRVT